jgi:6-phosphofructokinase
MGKNSRKETLRLAIATCGGDCPGLNAAISSLVRQASQQGYETVGIKDGMNGFFEGSETLLPLTLETVRGILNLGGTILGTSNKGNPFRDEKGKKQALTQVKKAWSKLGIDAMIAIGGDGSHYMMKELVQVGLNIVGIPKTIDNDLGGSEISIGWSTAVDTSTAAAMALKTSADAHNRIMILEVMGRDSGHIALSAGISAGADCILLPEIEFDVNKVVEHFNHTRTGDRTSYLVVAAEGATPAGMDKMFKTSVAGALVLGGIGQHVASTLHEQTGVDARTTVLGHIQRGGSPNAADKILASRFATYALDLVTAKNFGNIVGVKNGKLYHFPYEKLKATRYKIPLNSDLIHTAESIGICLGR